LQAEIAFRTGEVVVAGDRLEDARAAADEHGYAIEALRARLLAAGLARGRGDDATVTRLVEEVLATAEASGLKLEATAARVALGRARRLAADAPGRRLADRFGLGEAARFVLRDADGQRLLTSSLLAGIDPARHTLFIDFVSRRVRVGARTIDLARRGALLDVLRALAARPGEILSVEALTRAVWQMEYHPLRHHSRVTMAMSRLRALLGQDAVAGGTEGYRLTVDRWAVLEPI
jgi:hypothetical protein